MDYQKIFLTALTVVLLAVSWFMVKPFLGYILGAVLLAFLLRPLHERTRKFIGENLSAVLMIVLSICGFLLPVVFASTAVINDAQDLPRDINSSEIINTTDIEDKFERLTGRQINVENEANKAVDRFTSIAFGSFSRIFGIFANLVVGITLMLFLMYYFVKDGEKFVRWLRDLTPVDGDIQDQLYSQLNKTTWAVLKGHVLVAFVQGIVAGIGMLIAGVPNVVFWTFVMVLLGFIPIIGTAAVWLPASFFLILIGQPGSAIFLFIYGTVLVGLVDNIVRPLLVDRSADIHPAVIIIGVLGGVYLFGASGLFIGPVVLGVLKAVLIVCVHEDRSL